MCPVWTRDGEDARRAEERLVDECTRSKNKDSNLVGRADHSAMSIVKYLAY